MRADEYGTTLDRVPPQDLDAERACLGAMIGPVGTPEAILEVITILGDLAGDAGFYREAHSMIYAAILRLYDQQKAVDLVTLTVELTKTNDLEKVGGVPVLYEIIEWVPTAANAEYYALIVHKEHLRRKIINLGQQLYESGFDPTLEVDSIMDKASDAISGLDDWQSDLGSALLSVKDAGAEYADFIDHLDERSVKFNFPEFDKNLRFAPGDVCVIAAHTNVGKSCFAQTLQMNAWMRQQIRSVYFTLEMSTYQMYERLAAMMFSEHPRSIERWMLGEGREQVLNKLAETFADGFYYVDRPGLSLRDMERIVKKTKDTRLIVIDYLQLMRSTGNTRYEKMCNITSELKDFAKRTESAVIAVSQVTKSVRDQYARMVLGDLRDSGTIGEAPDLVIAMRSDVENDLIRYATVLKSRQMPRATGLEIELNFVGDSPLLGEAAKDESKDGYNEF